MTVPNALPSYVPAGRYLCEIKSDPVQRASRFSEGKFYIELALQIRDTRGQFFEYPFRTNLKSPNYHQILIVCGGKIVENGVTEGPETLIGKKFVAEIGVKLSQDQKRTINELLKVTPYVPKKPAPEEKIEEPLEEIEPIVDDEGDTIPF